jgi:hypothetical protein
MQFTIASKGRPIGTTDLAFLRIGGPIRSGYFYPASGVEELLPLIASPLPAVRAYLHRNVVDADGRPIVQPHLFGSPLFGDIAERLQHAASFDLTLHCADDSRVPTHAIAIQDTEPSSSSFTYDEGLLQGRICEMDDWVHGVDVDFHDDGEFPGIVAFRLDEATGEVHRFTPDVDVPEFPRYQVHVALVDDRMIP